MPESKSQIDARHYRNYRARYLKKAARYRRNNQPRIRAWRKANRRDVYLRFMTNPVNRLTTLFQKATKRNTFELRVLYALRANPPKRCACCNRLLNYACGKGNRRDSPSLDRWDNSQGYTLVNTFVVCCRCNTLKSDASVKEIRYVLAYMKRKPK